MKNPNHMTEAERLAEIKEIIERVDNRAMAADGEPYPTTMQEMRQSEMSCIYQLAGGKLG